MKNKLKNKKYKKIIIKEVVKVNKNGALVTDFLTMPSLFYLNETTGEWIRL